MSATTGERFHFLADGEMNRMTAEGLRRNLDRAFEERRQLQEEKDRLADRRKDLERQIETLQRLRSNARSRKAYFKSRKGSDG